MQRLFCCVLCAAVLLLAGASGAFALVNVNLSNKSGVAITNLSVTRKGDERPLSINMNLANNASTSVPLTEADSMTYTFTHSRGSFEFRNVANYGEPTLQLSMMDNVPVLHLLDTKGKVTRGVVGMDSRWKFPQVLGYFPYGVGVTSMAEARRMGAQPSRDPQILTTKQRWRGAACTLGLKFNGTAPGSVLQIAQLDFPAVMTDFGIIPAIQGHGYVRYHSRVGDKDLEVYRMLREGRSQDEIQAAFQALFPKNMITVRHWYAPKEFVETLVKEFQGTPKELMQQVEPFVVVQLTVGMPQSVALYLSR